MGLMVFVYRPANFPDCTNGGVSYRYDTLTLVNVPGPFEPSENAPAAWLVPGNLPKTAKIVVVDPKEEKRWHMFGGNYAGSSDGRFDDALFRLTGGWHQCLAPIHDRYEG